ncbi:glucokinase [Nocardia amikacinitolerans]|uniref:ROK family protein n=1 Tax=Nocardia amikacinitolerans TaxID=756689 RepID=UPI0020A43F0B|nr:ROK family protein [Nocardia amikacinitolerans]MCP2298883.1 glucokinase [Nocardia amikacinitolerans]
MDTHRVGGSAPAPAPGAESREPGGRATDSHASGLDPLTLRTRATPFGLDALALSTRATPFGPETPFGPDSSTRGAGASSPGTEGLFPATEASPQVPGTSTQGTPASPLDSNALTLGLDVGGTTIKGEIADASGTIHAAGTVPTPRGETAFEAMGELGDSLLAELPADRRGRLGRAAVLLPGIVDAARSIAVFSGNVGWRDVHVGDRFTTRWGVPVLIEHDVAVAGWAEWRFGAGRDHGDVLVIVLGTGVSGTLSVGGRLVRSAFGQAGEYGHIPVRSADGLPCPCGNVGCVETLASAAAIARNYARLSGHEVGSAANVFGRLPDDTHAVRAVDDAVAALADGLLGVIHAACPELVVLGGGLAGAGAALSERLQTALEQRLRVVPVPKVVLGEFGARAGLAGATLFARYGALI